LAVMLKFVRIFAQLHHAARPQFFSWQALTPHLLSCFVCLCDAPLLSSYESYLRWNIAI